MNPFNNVELSKEQVKGLFEARKKMIPLLAKAQERLLDLPLREIIDPAQGVSDLRRFATSEELQRIVMDVFCGAIVVDTKLVREKAIPAVVARVLLMTTAGLVPLISSTASQCLNEMFGGRAVLVAESRAIRRALRDLGLRAEFEIYDEEDRILKSDVNVVEAKSQVASKEGGQKEEECLVLDLQDDDVVDAEDEDALVAEKNAPKNITKRAKANVSRRKSKTSVSRPQKAIKDDGDEVVTKKSIAEISTLKDKKETLPLEPIEVIVDYDHADWPNRRKTNYPSVLSKGVDSARHKLGLTMSEFVQAVLGTKRFENKKAITFRSLKTTDLETLYQFYLINNDGNKQ
ncbi:hypothetical protein [Alteromonas sp. 14N.309.X.WAT.G.H12]|uniref:hypothetical protein n=1 Tax=Alteromonas sp. 14N.309.X.WAT.G.H12 TaxID=3120824 RepID=UPI002FD2A1A5